ncbi:MAG TPA: DUF1365 domain-containing protein [Kofleriaceae bacterium]|nr:DUF1365 domain-containing protein [Kofleriaceae bacterium]
MFHSALYRGELVHARHDSLARRAFRYPVYVASLDLDELPALDRSLRLFSHRGRNLFAFDDRDYDGADALRAGNALPAPHATRLITNLRVLGYVFNPVSFFLDYDARGAVAAAIAEVNNTYGGRFRYVLDASTRTGSGTFRHARELFVSPFLHGDLVYDFAFDAPLDGDRLGIEMVVHDTAGRRVFTARLDGARVPLSDRALAAAAIRYPLMTAQVIGLIHWQALKLRALGVPYRRPGRDHRPLRAV